MYIVCIVLCIVRVHLFPAGICTYFTETDPVKNSSLVSIFSVHGGLQIGVLERPGIRFYENQLGRCFFSL